MTSVDQPLPQEISAWAQPVGDFYCSYFIRGPLLYRLRTWRELIERS